MTSNMPLIRANSKNNPVSQCWEMILIHLLKSLLFFFTMIQGLQSGCCDFFARRLIRPVRGRGPETEQCPPHHVAGGSEWMVSWTTAARGRYSRSDEWSALVLSVCFAFRDVTGNLSELQLVSVMTDDSLQSYHSEIIWCAFSTSVTLPLVCMSTHLWRDGGSVSMPSSWRTPSSASCEYKVRNWFIAQQMFSFWLIT